MGYIDELEIAREHIWKNFVSKNGIINKFTQDNITAEIKEEMERINFIKESNIPSVATSITEDGKARAANYFIINDLGYGEVCEKCGSSLYILLLQDEDYLKDLDNRIWVPSLETYYSLHIPVGDINRYFPVPINPDKDLWICPYCREIHNFYYDSNIGLMYKQDISQNFL